MTHVDCMVHQIILRTADLQKLDESQRQLFLTLGHAANEIAALYRAAYAAGMDDQPGADLITRQIARAQTLLMLRMPASKMQEVFDITGSPAYGKIIKGVYPEFLKTKHEIETRIAEQIELKKLRNDFGFHYKANFYKNINTSYLQDAPSDETHDIVLDRVGVNCFFAVSEFFVQKAFAAALKTARSYEEFAQKKILELVHDMFSAVDKLIIAIHHLMLRLCTSVDIDLKAPERHNETSARFTPATDARLPTFLLFRQMPSYSDNSGSESSDEPT